MEKRREIIFSSVDVRGKGLEIGPCNHPVAPKSEGYDVDIVDWTSETTLRKNLVDDPDVENIETVDYVWTGESYVDLIGEEHKYDWIIASHVIEHVPDMVSFLKNCESVLKPGGIFVLAVPDKRYCFDQFRPATALRGILDAYHSGVTKPTPGAVLDYYLNVSSKGGDIAWGSSGDSSVDNGLLYDWDTATDHYSASLQNENYIDVHNWCFTPSSFRLILGDLFKLGLTPLKECSFTATLGCEFFVALSRNRDGCSLSRLQLLELALNEQMTPYNSKSSFRKKWKKRLKRRVGAL